jgi:hypothetical protein
MDDLSFRSFHPDDLPTCAKFAAEAWPVVSALVPGQDVAKLMHAYVELGRLPSTRLEVACVSGKVVGLLFGILDDRHPGHPRRVRTPVKAIDVSAKID